MEFSLWITDIPVIPNQSGVAKVYYPISVTRVENSYPQDQLIPVAPVDNSNGEMMFRVKSVWSGGVGLPGYTNFYWSSLGGDNVGIPANAITRIMAFWEAIKNTLPIGIRIDVDNNVDLLDPVTGNLTDVLQSTGGGTITPFQDPSLANYSAPTGACITWTTAGFVAGRRVKGRTFIVPLTHACFDAQGNIQTGNLTTLRDAANGLFTVGGGDIADMVVWHRPRKGSPFATPPVAATPGSEHLVTAASVKDKAAVLTSRRD